MGIELTAEQRTQLHGLLKRPNPEPEDPRCSCITAAGRAVWVTAARNHSVDFKGSRRRLDEFDWAPQPMMVCRDASSSAYGDMEQVSHCAGDQTQHHLSPTLHEQKPFGDTSNKSAGEVTLVSQL